MPPGFDPWANQELPRAHDEGKEKGGAWVLGGSVVGVALEGSQERFADLSGLSHEVYAV